MFISVLLEDNIYTLYIAWLTTACISDSIIAVHNQFRQLPSEDIWFKASDGLGTETCQQGSRQTIGMNMSIWVHWSGIEPGTTGFDSNLTSVLPLSYGYWDKSSGQGTEHDIPFPQAIIVQARPRTCEASHGVES